MIARILQGAPFQLSAVTAAVILMTAGLIWAERAARRKP